MYSVSDSRDIYVVVFCSENLIQLIIRTTDTNIIRYYTVISITWRICILSVETKEPHQSTDPPSDQQV